MATNLAGYYSEKGQTLPSVQARSSVYESMGLGSSAEYKGTADQNTRLLQALSAGAARSTAPAQPQAQPQVQAPSYSAPTPAQSSSPQSAQDLINMGYSGYAGWGNNEAIADFRATGGNGKGGPTAGGGIPGFSQPTIDLPGLYNSLYQSSGVKDKETQLSQKEQELAAVKAKINDNPFLSEATRVGRIAKIDQLYNDQTAGIRNDIARSKADIETQLNLQTKQFDINSQQTQQALSQFNSLLSGGALDNVSGQDISNLTRSTGLSSAMIQSAIDANKRKNVQTSIIQYDDGKNQGFTVVNSQTGEIIKKQTVSQSKPSAAKSAKQPSEQENRTMIINDLQQELSKGLTLQDALRIYSGYLDPTLIYQLYNSGSIYGAAQESPDQLAKYGVKTIKTS